MEALLRQLDTHLRATPQIGTSVYIARGSSVIGDVRLGDFSSVWYGAVLRGDIQRIEVGAYSNVQDNAVLHVADEYPCRVGNWVTIGHSATIHACTIGDECLIGMGAIILDGSVIGAQSLIAAGAVVTPGTEIPPGSMVVGTPGRVKRALTDEERAGLKHWAEKYVVNGSYCLRNQIQVGGPLTT